MKNMINNLIQGQMRPIFAVAVVCGRCGWAFPLTYGDRSNHKFMPKRQGAMSA